MHLSGSIKRMVRTEEGHEVVQVRKWESAMGGAYRRFVDVDTGRYIYEALLCGLGLSMYKNLGCLSFRDVIPGKNKVTYD